MSLEIVALIGAGVIVLVAAFVMRRKSQQPIDYSETPVEHPVKPFINIHHDSKTPDEPCRPLDEPDLPEAHPIAANFSDMVYMGPTGIVPGEDPRRQFMRR